MTPMLRPEDESLQWLEHLDQLCDRFEAAWKAGQSPRIEEFVGETTEPRRTALLRELIWVEVFHRERRGETPRLEEYHNRFPGLDSARLSEVFQRSSTMAPDLLSTHQSGIKDSSGNSSTAPWSASKTTVADSARRFRKRLFGDYEQLEEIGKGGMGVVYRAYHLPSRRIVALKVIRPDRLEDLSADERREWLSRFRKEAQAAARSEHPNVVTVYDVGAHEEILYYSMQYVDGQSLAGLLAEGPLPNRRAAEYLEPVARAVHHIHNNGVLHRDLKPKNILIDQADRPHVTDFGLAKWPLDSGPSLPTGGPVGTPSYMAPEQAQQPAKSSVASDVYSLGATLYEMLTGRPPFQAADPVETLRQVIDVDPVPPRRLNPAIHRDLERICLKCLAKEPHRRYASAEQLADELQCYLRGEPLRHTRHVGGWERLQLWCRRNPALALARGVAALTLVLFVSVVLGFSIREHFLKTDLEEALTDLQVALKVSQDRRDQLARSSAIALGYGLTLSEPRHVADGMLWLGHGLEVATQAEKTALERTIRFQLASRRDQLCPLQAVFPHPQPVSAAALGPDGQVLLIGGTDGTAQLWRVSTEEPIGDPLKHGDPINAAAFSPDGKWVVTGCGQPGWEKVSREPLARIWDARSGKLLHTLPHKGAVLTVGFSSDGKTLFTGSWHNLQGALQLWHADTGREIGPLFPHPGRVVAASLSPDGKTLLTACVVGQKEHERQKVCLWEVETARLLSESLPEEKHTLAVTFSSEGKALWAAYEAGAVQVCEIVASSGETKTAQTRLQWSLPQHAVPQTAAFCPDGRMLLTGNRDGRAQLWDLRTGQPLGAAVVNQDAVTAVAFGPGSSTFLTGCCAKTVRLWKEPPGGPTPLPLITKNPLHYTAAYSPDGRMVLTASTENRQSGLPSTIELWDTLTGAPAGPPLLLNGYIIAIAPNPVRNSVLIGGSEPDPETGRGQAQEWDLATGMPVGEPLIHPGGYIGAVAWSPDGTLALTASSDGEVALWESATGRRIALPPQLRHQHIVASVAFSLEGRWVVTSSWDKTALLWDRQTGEVLKLKHDSPVRAVAFCPDGQTVWTASGDPAVAQGEAQQWSVLTGQPVGSSLQHQDAVLALACSLDGQMILTGCADGTAHLWDGETGLPLGPALHHDQAVRTVAFHPAGAQLLTASRNQLTRLWPVPTPLRGEVQRVQRWVETITGMELSQEGGPQARVLDWKTWRQRRQQLRELGGAPPP